MSLISQDETENEVIFSETEFEQDYYSYTSSKKYFSCSDSIITKESYIFKPFKCSCYEHLESTKLTRNKILALIWALISVLKYHPVDPIYYMSYQLLHWRHNNVPKKYIKDIVDYMNSQL
ncbi:major centromere autoantigen [Vespula maculifrons]|uniref:Major centromere autoantigen n=1 Tax=Vespula maculifrons TaxID=7453 RepID=A0ABD2BXG6_VESMC